MLTLSLLIERENRQDVFIFVEQILVKHGFKLTVKFDNSMSKAVGVKITGRQKDLEVLKASFEQAGENPKFLDP